MKTKKFYAILAANGAMVTNDYDRAQFCCSTYYRKPSRIKKFDTEAEANEAATDHLWEVAPLDKAIPEQLVLNKVYTGRNLPYTN